MINGEMGLIIRFALIMIIRNYNGLNVMRLIINNFNIACYVWMPNGIVVVVRHSVKEILKVIYYTIALKISGTRSIVRFRGVAVVDSDS